MSLREQLRAFTNPKPKRYDVEFDFDGQRVTQEIYVRTLTVGEILSQQVDVAKAGDENRAALARAFCRTVTNADNSPVYNPDSKEDVQEVLTLDWQFVRAAMETANKHNGLGGVETPKV